MIAFYILCLIVGILISELYSAKQEVKMWRTRYLEKDKEEEIMSAYQVIRYNKEQSICDWVYDIPEYFLFSYFSIQDYITGRSKRDPLCEFRIYDNTKLLSYCLDGVWYEA